MKRISAGCYQSKLSNGVTILVLKTKHGDKWYFRAFDTESNYIIYESEEYCETKTSCIYWARKFVKDMWKLEL